MGFAQRWSLPLSALRLPLSFRRQSRKRIVPRARTSRMGEPQGSSFVVDTPSPIDGTTARHPLRIILGFARVNPRCAENPGPLRVRGVLPGFSAPLPGVDPGEAQDRRPAGVAGKVGGGGGGGGVVMATRLGASVRYADG